MIHPTRVVSSSCVSSSTKKVVVALSGGVDSSVAAALIVEQYKKAEVAALHMSNWDTLEDDSVSSCTSEKDFRDALLVANHLKIPLNRVTSLQSDYWCSVFEPYIERLAKGITGNPDIACNTHVKFGALWPHIQQKYGRDAQLATGHYARLWHRNKNANEIPDCVQEQAEAAAAFQTLDWLRRWGGSDGLDPLLLAANDRTKDQSYFLSGCHAASLRHVLFPLGEYCKNNKPPSDIENNNVNNLPTVRQLAGDWQLPSATKRDSMGICFVGKRKAGFASFVQDYLPPPQKKLQFVDIDTNQVLHRTHEPAHHVLYTTGQGAKLAGLATKYFVVDNDHHHHYHHDNSSIDNNDNDFHTITVCAGTHHPALYSDSLTLQSVHWMSGGGSEPPLPLRLYRRLRAQCRTRHLQPLVDCTLELLDDDSSSTVRVILDAPLRAITVGQHAVFYCLNGLVCLGGGPIANRGASYLEQGKTLPAVLHPAGHNDLPESSSTTWVDDNDTTTTAASSSTRSAAAVTAIRMML